MRRQLLYLFTLGLDSRAQLQALPKRRTLYSLCQQCLTQQRLRTLDDILPRLMFTRTLALTRTKGHQTKGHRTKSRQTCIGTTPIFRYKIWSFYCLDQLWCSVHLNLTRNGWVKAGILRSRTRAPLDSIGLYCTISDNIRQRLTISGNIYQFWTISECS